MKMGAGPLYCIRCGGTVREESWLWVEGILGMMAFPGVGRRGFQT